MITGTNGEGRVERSALGRLGDHLERLRRQAPGERLLVLVDADGTLFGGGAAESSAGRPGATVPPGPVDAAPGARGGLLEVLRWLQIHPSTFVALASERGPQQRAQALEELRRLAGPGRLRLGDDLLALGTPGSAGDAAWRLELLERYASLGFRIAAALVRDGRAARELHAPLAAEGALVLGPEAFDELTAHEPAPDVALAGRGLATTADLEAFLGSSLGWGEVRLVSDSRGEPQVAGEDGGPGSLVLEELAGVFAQFGKGLRLDLGADEQLALRTLRQLERLRLSAGELAFCAPLGALARAGHRSLAEARPEVPWIAAAWSAAPRSSAEGEPAQGDWLRDLDRVLEVWGEGGQRLRPVVPWDHPERAARMAASDSRGLRFEFDEPGDLVGYLRALGYRPASISGALPALGARFAATPQAALPRPRGSSPSGAERIGSARP